MKRAFVTGSNGFLGINLLRQLVDDGWKVLAFDRSSSNAKVINGSDVQFFKGDRTIITLHIISYTPGTRPDTGEGKTGILGIDLQYGKGG